MRGQQVSYWEKVKRILGIIWVDKQLKKLFLPLWLSRFIFVCSSVSIIVSLSIIGSAFVYKVIEGDKAVDYVFKVLGGGFALISLAIVSWRSIAIASRHSMISEKQVNSDRFVKSVEQIASQDLAIRLGGLASLHALSKENKEEYQQVWTYLGSFLRHRRPLDNDKDEPTSPFPDVAYIAKMLRERDKKRIEDYESKFKLDLEGANLEGADLRGAHLDGADLRGANLEEANLEGADLWCANLERAHLKGANLEKANLEEANLSRANLERAYLKRTDLERTNLSDALFGKKNGAQDLTNLTPDQLKGIFYRNDDGYHAPKLPDNLPEGCKPRPISYSQWNQIRGITIRKVS